MKLFVQITFDLQGAEKPQYDAMESWLAQIGLRKTLPGSEAARVNLPHNTFAGERDCYSSPAEAIAHIREHLRNPALWDFCEGRAFISASPFDSTAYGEHRITLATT